MLLDSIKDLIKYQSMRYINTGDRALDNLLNVLVICLIGIVFSSSIPTNFWYYYYDWKIRFGWKLKRKYICPLLCRGLKSICCGGLCLRNRGDETANQTQDEELDLETNIWPISENNYSYICDIFRHKYEKKAYGVTWYSNITQYRQFHDLITIKIKEKLPWIFKGIKIHELKPLPNSMPTFYGNNICDKQSLKLPLENQSYPFLIQNNQFLSIKHLPENSGYYLLYTDVKLWEKFAASVMKKITVEEKPKFPDFMNGQSYSGVISEVARSSNTLASTWGYIDREFTMDHYVSRHKNYLCQLFNDLSVYQKNPYFSKNLGILLSGSPGTGKTSFIKAICNHTQRNPCIIDMRLIKTFSSLKSIMNFVKKNLIFIFEEFDDLPVFQIRHSTAEGNTVLKEIQFIKSQIREYEHHLQKTMTLKTRTNMNAEEKCQIISHDDTIKQLKKQISDLNSQLVDMDDQLTPDKFLTFLDGLTHDEGRVIIATTNHIELIDPAFKRPGRFDVVITLTKFNSDETRELLGKIFNDLTPKQKSVLEKFKFPNEEYTPTEIIHLCRSYHNFNVVLEKIKHKFHLE